MSNTANPPAARDVARLCLDFLSGLAIPPVDFIKLAAQLDCQSISLALAPITANPHGYRPWSLRADPSARQDVMAALDDHGISVSHGEGIFLSPRSPAASFAADLDILAELGVSQVTLVTLDRDPDRGLAELTEAAGLAAQRGLGTALEFAPGHSFGDLPSAIEAVRRVGSDMRLVIDLMHVFRSGATVPDLAGLPPDLVAHIQVCDVPRENSSLSYGEEALHERLRPGEGELPLAEAMAALPHAASVGLELPMLSQAAKGIGPYERLKPAVDAARLLLACRGPTQSRAASRF